MWKTSVTTNQPQACTGRQAALTQGLDGSDLGQFSNRDAAFDPHGVNVAERSQPVLEVTELLAVHEHTETTPLAANLQLQTHIHTSRSETASSHRGGGGHPQPSGYLERLVFNEGEEGDISLGVPPGSRHAGSADRLAIPEADAKLQRHVGWRFPRSSTTTSQGNVEPDRDQISHTHQYKINFQIKY